VTTDMENELRGLFREKAGEAPVATPAAAPQRVLRRSRLHQVGTVLGSAVVVVALIVGSVAGLTRILGDGNEDVVGSGDYEIFERTATIEAFTVTSPSDWFLVNHWPLSMQTNFAALALCPEETATTHSDCVARTDPVELDPALGLPMFQLTNEDIPLGSTACGAETRQDMAVLYIALDYDSDIAGVYPPYLPDPGERVLPPVGDGPCGPGRYASFTADGEPFFAWIGIGSAATAEERLAVENAYERMSVAQQWQPTRSDQVTPGYVIAGGTSEIGVAWRLELRPGEQSPELSLEGPDQTLVDVSVPENLTDTYYNDELTDPIFGTVTKDATGVEFRPGTENIHYDLGQSPVPGTIMPVPPTLGSFDFDLFFIDPPAEYAALGGHVIALGVDHVPSESPLPPAEPRGDEVELAGNAFGQRYRVRFTGAFADDTACIHVTLGGEHSEPLCPRPLETSLAGTQPSMQGVTTTKLNLLAGSVPPEVVEIRFTSDDETDPPTQFQCQMGPLGWTEPDRKVCVMALPAEGSGIFQYLDADGGVLFEEGMGWGVSEAEAVAPMPVDPVHGGTYWAVYAWLGSGDQEAQIEEAQRYLENRGVHGLRGSLSCDEGAAEALGTSADHKVAVYFETQEEANAFALQAGLLGHEAGPVVAQVTIVCLE
jgi:hypothetical protein